jgi:hypothetical protein
MVNFRSPVSPDLKTVKIGEPNAPVFDVKGILSQGESDLRLLVQRKR